MCSLICQFQVQLACRIPMSWLGKLWDRAQGKWHVERICEKVFDELSERGNMKVDKLPIATLLVYNSVNKQLLNPHKEPPPLSTIDKKMEELRRQKTIKETEGTTDKSVSPSIGAERKTTTTVETEGTTDKSVSPSIGTERKTTTTVETEGTTDKSVSPSIGAERKTTTTVETEGTTDKSVSPSIGAKRKTTTTVETEGTTDKSVSPSIGAEHKTTTTVKTEGTTDKSVSPSIGAETINLKEFKKIIMEWIKNDLKVVLANRAVLAFFAAPALAMATKRATKDVPHVGKAVEKVPTPLLSSLFSVGLVLLQDLRVG